MTITNGYATLSDYYTYVHFDSDTAVDADDDAALESLIEAASRYIDNITKRHWYKSSTDETRYFDAPRRWGDLLLFDLDCQSITSITNGDGSAIATGDVQLLPPNQTPTYGFKLKNPASGWRSDQYGNNFGAIAVTGIWGNVDATTSQTPAQIKEYCLAISKGYNDRRSGENVSGVAKVTAAGVVISPEDIPGFVREGLQNLRRIGFA